jgi:hypothetical protein
MSIGAGTTEHVPPCPNGTICSIVTKGDGRQTKHASGRVDVAKTSRVPRVRRCSLAAARDYGGGGPHRLTALWKLRKLADDPLL